MSECHTCKRGIRGEAGIRCAGVCEKIYHVNEKCCGIDKCSLGALQTASMIKFICDDCIQYIHNFDFALKDMQLEVKKNSAYIKECKDEFDAALKNNEFELKGLLEAIETRFAERMSEMEKVQFTCSTALDEIKQCYSIKDTFKQQSDKIFKELIAHKNINERVVKAVEKVTTAETADRSVAGVASYAEAVKRKAVVTRKKELPSIKHEVPLIVKPKTKQNSEFTLNDLNRKVDPKNLKITNVKAKYNGEVVIESSNATERNIIIKELEEKIGEKYDIEVPEVLNPRCFITGMSYQRDDNEVIDLIKKQNDWISTVNLKIVKSYAVKKNNKTYFNTILETDSITFTNILEREKLNIGWEKCKVYDGVDVLRCFKCRGFNHKATDCKNDVVCVRCLGNHLMSDCNKCEENKCVNCIRANEKFNLGLDDNNLMSSKRCPVY